MSQIPRKMGGERGRVDQGQLLHRSVVTLGISFRV